MTMNKNQNATSASLSISDYRILKYNAANQNQKVRSAVQPVQEGRVGIKCQTKTNIALSTPIVTLRKPIP
jgi:hypothetical protein